MSKSALLLLFLWLIIVVYIVVQDVSRTRDMEQQIRELKAVVGQQRLALQRYAGLEKGVKRLQDNLIRDSALLKTCLEDNAKLVGEM